MPEYEIETKTKDRRYVDGALLYELRMPFGYWEAKDEKDDLDAEIETKFRRGYPQDSIIFEDSTEAVLLQNRQEVMRCGVDDVVALEKLLVLFFAYERVEAGASPQPRNRKRGEGASERAEAPKAMRKADRDAGRIVLDTQTALAGIPPEAWDYKLRNRSALEWILDQYKEKKPEDPTIREKFDTYRFADYKEKVIDLLMRVTRVSVETQAIVEAIRKVAR